MSFISEVIPQASAAIAQQTAGPVVKAEPQNNSQAIQSQPAAVVSLSQESKSRTVSSGSNKYVDASFGSEKNRSESKTKSDSKNSKSSINVVA